MGVQYVFFLSCRVHFDKYKIQYTLVSKKGYGYIYIYSLYRFYSPRIENLNLLVRIKSLNLFLYSSLRKAKKFTGPNQVLLILGLRTGTHREGCFY